MNQSITVMKKFEDFTKEDLWALRQQVVLNSCFIADYRNTFGIDEHSAADLFEGFVDYMTEEEKEDGYENESVEEFFDRYDKPEFLWEWYMCFDDFSWVKYEPQEEDDEEGEDAA